MSDEHRDAVEAALRRCAIELVYVQNIENCNSGLCATGEGKEAIEQAERILGPMREWPEIVEQAAQDTKWKDR